MKRNTFTIGLLFLIAFVGQTTTAEFSRRHRYDPDPDSRWKNNERVLFHDLERLEDRYPTRYREQRELIEALIQTRKHHPYSLKEQREILEKLYSQRHRYRRSHPEKQELIRQLHSFRTSSWGMEKEQEQERIRQVEAAQNSLNSTVNTPVKPPPKTIQSFEELDKLFIDIKAAKEKELKREGSADESKNAIKVLGELKGDKEAELNAIKTLSETKPSSISQMEEMLTILRHSEFPEVRREMMRLRLQGLDFRKGELTDPVAKLSHLKTDEVDNAQDLYREITALRNACPGPSKKEEWKTQLNELETSLKGKRDAAKVYHKKELEKTQAMKTAFLNSRQYDKYRKYYRAVEELRLLLSNAIRFESDGIAKPYEEMAKTLMGSGEDHFKNLKGKAQAVTHFKKLVSPDFDSWSIPRELFLRKYSFLIRCCAIGLVRG